MGVTKPYTKRERQRLARGNHHFGHRPLCDWGAGDLPAPFAVGDVLHLGEPSTLDRLTERGMGEPGWYVVCDAWSIDEGDAWYFRVTTDRSPDRSDRLHWACAERSTWPEDVNYLDGFELVDTADPNGAALRERMLADGWTFTPEPTVAQVERLSACLQAERELADLLADTLRRIGTGTPYWPHSAKPTPCRCIVCPALAAYDAARTEGAT